MSSPNTEELPDYHELTSTRQAQRDRADQFKKDTVEVRGLSGKRYLAFLIFCYLAFAISSWVLLCLIGRGPTYIADGWHGNDLRPWRKPANGQRELRAALVLGVIAAVLTLPTAASVFAYAAVPFAQYRAKGQKLSARQTLALANQEWMSPRMIPILLTPTLSRRHGSHLFWFGCLFTILGLAIWPVQQGFIEPLSTTKIASHSSSDSVWAFDIPQLFVDSDYPNQDVVILRTKMDSFSTTDCNPHLWWNGTQEDYADWRQNCAKASPGGYDTSARSFSEYFTDDGAWNKDTVFMSQMPFGFHTGFKRAWVPRFNTSIDYENITATGGVPEGCFTDEDNADFIQNKYDWVDPDEEDSRYGDSYDWHLWTCISTDALTSPMKSGTRDRQDFEEVFYLNITASLSTSTSTNTDFRTPNIFRVSAHTTVGYFELPNHHNNGAAGPLLDKFTLPDDDDDTYTDSYAYPRPTDPTDLTTPSPSLEAVPAKGPLATIYLALFGRGSFPAAWTDPRYLAHLNGTAAAASPYACQTTAPMASILRAVSYRSHGPTCVAVAGARTALAAQAPMRAWLANFAEADAMRGALRVAAFMANEARLLMAGDGGAAEPGYRFQVDAGVEVTAPVVPRAGVVVGSVLLGAFAAALLGLAVWAVSAPRWTERLDAGAMMKMGAAMALGTEGVAALGGGGEGVLDAAPGFVGDAMPESEVGRLAVGAEGPVRRRRRYEASMCGVMPR